MKLLCAVGVVLALAKFAIAAEKKESRVTEVVRDVQLLASHVAPRPAAVNDTVREGTAIRTGIDSRAELAFADLTLARLGANTIFSFGAATRTYDLGNGAILVSAPKEAGTVKITTPAVTAAVSGFTAILERHTNAWNKFILLHGTGTLTLKNVSSGPCRLHTGQMMVFPPNPTRCPPVLDVDLSKLLQGNLIKGFKRPLPELDLILADVENQQTSPPSSGLIDPTNQDAIDQSINARPTPPPTPRTFPSPPPGKLVRPK